MIWPRRDIPLVVPILFTAFLAWLVPNYWRYYGPGNFLFFCDFGSLVTCVGLWLQSPLLLGMEAVALLVPQTVWVVDLISRLCGHPLFGMTEYMFDPNLPQSTRLLSTFHGWLPILLVWAVRRVGYDRRSLAAQTLAGTALLVACYVLTGPAANVNYVHGPPEGHRQLSIPPLAWLSIVIAVAVVGMFVPAHLLLRRLVSPPRKD